MVKYSHFFSCIKNEYLQEFFSDVEMLEFNKHLNQFIVNKWFSKGESFIHPTAEISENSIIEGLVYIGSGVKIQPFSYIKGPAVILNDTLIGKSAFIRDNCIIGNNCLIGHSSEIARTILVGNTTLSHIVGISDSIIGSNVNFGAFSSATTHLLKGKQNKIVMSDGSNKSIENKLGSIIGDYTQIGAYVQLNPGVIMEPNCIVYPQISVSTNYYKNNMKIYINGFKKSVKTKRIIQEEQNV